jgi:hypothetical protein
MEESELGELMRCVACGVEINPAIDRGFEASPDRVLCSNCAERRGGVWDEARSTWSREPDLIGLPHPDPRER